MRLPTGWDRGDPALAVLRQEYEFRPAAELDALANALADLILGRPGPSLIHVVRWETGSSFIGKRAGSRAPRRLR